MTVYHQDVVIDQLNRFLEYRQYPQRLEKGYCHGLTLLWLDKISRGKEQSFYDTIKLIVECEDKKAFKQHEKVILTFLKRIEWLQNSEKYSRDITQLDIDKLLDLPDKFSISFIFNTWQLGFILDYKIKNNKMVCISGGGHSIGVFKRGELYHFFDCNDDDGVARIYQEIDEVEKAVLDCLFTREEQANGRFLIDINIISRTSRQNHPHKTDLFTYLVKTSHDIDLPAYNETNNLLLACKRKDEEEMKILLAHGANPNHARMNGVTPLHTAVDAGHLPSVNLLLQHGASPLQPKLKGDTPLSIALLNHHWDITVSLLLHINHSDDIGKNDISLLQSAEQEIIATLSLAWPTLKAKEKNHLKKIIADVYQLHYRHGFFSEQTRSAKKIARFIPPFFHLRKRYEELSDARKKM